MAGIPIDDAARDSSLLKSDLEAMIAAGDLTSETDATSGTVLVDAKAVTTLSRLKEEERKNVESTREIAALKLAISRPQDRAVPWLALAVAVIGVLAAFCQIRNAIKVFQTNNDYKMQSDYTDFFRTVIEAPPDKLKFYVGLYDAKFSSIHDLYKNGGISAESWRAIATQACPRFRNEGFSLGGTKLVAVEKICNEDKTL